jgi:hypothetical protein
MAYIRVPFFGSLLVEVDDTIFADIPSGMWCASMRQATHNAPMQEIRPEIKAVEFCVERSKMEDVTKSLQQSMERDAESAKANPGGQILANMFCQQLSDLQWAWESHEFKTMRPASEIGEENNSDPTT